MAKMMIDLEKKHEMACDSCGLDRDRRCGAGSLRSHGRKTRGAADI
jgi:hypothetical protein